MTEATPEVLFVDDEPNVLAGIRRQLRRRFRVDTAASPEEGLAKLRDRPYPVIVSDMRMPGMNGAQFLHAATRIRPHAVRMVLSGEASLDAAIDAVNNGAIWRYLRKPTDSATLIAGVEQALRRHDAAAAERTLLEDTLGGAVDTLLEALQLAHPAAFRTTGRVARIAIDLGQALDVQPAWELAVAARLVYIGCIALSDATLAVAMLEGRPAEDFARHAAIGRELVERIPRLERAARMIGDHLRPASAEELTGFDGLDVERRGAILLGIATEADRAVSRGLRKAAVLATLEGRLPPRLLKALAKARMTADGEVELRTLRIDDLEVGMVCQEPIETVAGLRLTAAGTELTLAMKTRILNFHRSAGCREPVRVALPAT
jgi:DNA-binding response OmpR family regulator